MKNAPQSFYGWYKSTLRNPKYRWIILLGSLAYLLSPIDISPDFIPIVGWIDDGLVATLLIAEVSQIATEFLTNRKRPVAERTTAQDTPPVTVDVA